MWRYLFFTRLILKYSEFFSKNKTKWTTWFSFTSLYFQNNWHYNQINLTCDIQIIITKLLLVVYRDGGMVIQYQRMLRKQNNWHYNQFNLSCDIQIIVTKLLLLVYRDGRMVHSIPEDSEKTGKRRIWKCEESVILC